MKPATIFAIAAISIFFIACKQTSKKEEAPASFLSAKEVIRFNQLIYKDSTASAFAKYAPDYEVVFTPKAVDGNYAIITKNKKSNQYAVVIRGSVIEFNNEGFQNFILQDFNIFTMKKWTYVDTVQDAYISKGAMIGFQNLLQLRDISSGLTIKEFIEQKIPDASTVVITGHSLGGNLAYPLAGYLKKELVDDSKKKLQLITFGAPAAGNAAFVNDLELKFPKAERYVMDRDIAPVFPDLDKIGELSKMIGLDSVLQIGKLSIEGLETKIDASKIFEIAGKVLEKTNVINTSNKYVQSEKHLRLLTTTDTTKASGLSADAIFANAYRYHKVDGYAVMLGGEELK